jgi:Holliday junction resolvase
MKRKKSAKTEQDIQKEIIDYLTLNGWFVWKNKNVNRGTGKYLPTYQKGVPDLVGIKNGDVWFIEIKTPEGKLSVDQDYFLDMIRKHGGSIAVLRSIRDAEFLNYEPNRSK